MLNRLAGSAVFHGGRSSRPVAQCLAAEHVNRIAANITAASTPPLSFSSPASIARPSLVLCTRSSALRVNRSMIAGERSADVSPPRHALHLDRGDHRREDSLVLLEIERDLLVAELGQQRPDDEAHDDQPRIATTARMRVHEHRQRRRI